VKTTKLEGPWTRFMDMHSGGSLKEDPAQYIYIEAPESEARAVFYSKFGHSPDRVTCTCCGEDYSVDEAPTFARACAFDRGCRWVSDERRNKDGSLVTPGGGHYEDNPVPADAEGLERFKVGKYQTVEQYKARPDVLVIPASEIKPEWRTADVPRQGFVWQD